MKDELRRFLARDRIAFEDDAERSMVRYRCEGRMGSWLGYARVDEGARLLHCCAVAPTRAPRELRAQAMELVTRANFGLPVGCFELNLDDGELRCRTVLDGTGVVVTVDAVAAVFYSNMVVFDRYLPALGIITTARVDVARLVQQIERGESVTGG